MYPIILTINLTSFSLFIEIQAEGLGMLDLVKSSLTEESFAFTVKLMIRKPYGSQKNQDIVLSICIGILPLRVFLSQ